MTKVTYLCKHELKKRMAQTQSKLSITEKAKLHFQKIILYVWWDCQVIIFYKLPVDNKTVLIFNNSNSTNQLIQSNLIDVMDATQQCLSSHCQYDKSCHLYICKSWIYHIFIFSDCSKIFGTSFLSMLS